MNPKSTRIEQQINTFGYPLTRLVEERGLSVRLTFPGNMRWIQLVHRWHERNARELRNAGKASR